MSLPPTIAYAVRALTLAALVAPWRDQLSDRIRHLRDGIRGIRYVPIMWAVLIPSGLLAIRLADRIPFLDWGWAGANILVAPVVNANTGSGSDMPVADTTSQTTTPGPQPLLDVALAEIFALALFFVGLLTVFLIFNYEEERWGRETWSHVAGWAVSHLLMGIPIFATIPIFVVGAVMKHIHDAHGLNEAFAAHVAYNTSLASLLIGVIVFV